MKKMEIMFQSKNDIVDFVNEISECECHADLAYGSYTIDAKSLLGVLSLGYGKLMELNLYCDDSEEPKINFEKYSFAAKM